MHYNNIGYRSSNSELKVAQRGEQMVCHSELKDLHHRLLLAMYNFFKSKQ